MTIEINLTNLQKEERIHVKGHQTKTGYVKSHVRVVKGTPQTDISNEDKYKDSTEQVTSWVDKNPDRKEDVDNTYNYCKAGYEIINQTMRRIPDDGFSEFLPPEDIQSISNFLRDAPKFEGTVYRGVTINDKGEFNKFMEGIKKGTIQMKPFTSTTIDQKMSKGFAYLYPRVNPPIYMEIKSKNGVSTSGISHFYKENEVLFDYGTKFKITNYDITDKEINIKLEEI